ncbi:MAG: CopG family ribbon-helix-helix protein [Burkholderiales bacterium]
MTLTVRLDPALESAFTRACKRRGTTKSAVISSAVRDFVHGEDAQRPSVAELGRDLFGADTSPLPTGVVSVSANVKALLKQKLRAKHSR